MSKTIEHKFDATDHCIYCEFSKKQLKKGVKILDLGCGTNKHEDAIGIDIVKLEDVDMVYDLNKIPYPFEKNEFDLIYMNDIIEHLENPIEIFKEVYRLLKPLCKLKLKVVHWSHRFSYGDPQHKHAFDERYFKVLTGEIRAYYLDFHFTNLNINYLFDRDAIQIWTGKRYNRDLTEKDKKYLFEVGQYKINVIQGMEVELMKPGAEN